MELNAFEKQQSKLSEFHLKSPPFTLTVNGSTTYQSSLSSHSSFICDKMSGGTVSRNRNSHATNTDCDLSASSDMHTMWPQSMTTAYMNSPSEIESCDHWYQDERVHFVQVTGFPITEQSYHGDFLSVETRLRDIPSDSTSQYSVNNYLLPTYAECPGCSPVSASIHPSSQCCSDYECSQGVCPLTYTTGCTNQGLCYLPRLPTRTSSRTSSIDLEELSKFPSPIRQYLRSGTRRFKSACALKIEKQHTHKCFLCSRVYTRPSTLKTHLRTHAGLRPYRCMCCAKRFSQLANLTAHVRTHSGERPFHCPVCQKRFSQSSSVTTHLRTHSGERPYACNFCSKAFADSSTLTKHIRVHSGEKPYRCEQCKMGFSQSGNLKRHVRVHINRGDFSFDGFHRN
ncbi:zinc finger, C2H2 type [Opisthorchis viverrini]|uniref:Zinc finger, C2H2 type n=1 Tax=Opisthorchis viverrini TaxID=6198 RepID=A0A1S8X3F3_OPIVI|nr:zinc finger, C2H2 type [Opisthorchis viverrini]